MTKDSHKYPLTIRSANNIDIIRLFLRLSEVTAQEITLPYYFTFGHKAYPSRLG